MKKKTSIIGIDIDKDGHMNSDKENDDFIEYEFALRQNLDLAIQETGRVIGPYSIVL